MFFAALILIVAFGFLLFHHHPHGEQHTSECVVCRIVQYFSFIFSALIIFFTSLGSARFFVPVYLKLSPSKLPRRFLNRAPPKSK